VFWLTAPSEDQIRGFISTQHQSQFSYPEVGASACQIPNGYNYDWLYCLRVLLADPIGRQPNSPYSRNGTSRDLFILRGRFAIRCAYRLAALSHEATLDKKAHGPRGSRFC
jgi:hypothetical protein